MNRSFAGLLVLVAMLLPAGLAFGAESRVMVSHTMAGYNKGTATVTLDYSLHVMNNSDTPVVNLSLTLVPMPPFITNKTTVDVGYLGAHQSADVSLLLVTKTLLSADRFSQQPLFFVGKYLDGEGKTAEFPVKSKPGGAR
jgi:hypothetical protein